MTQETETLLRKALNAVDRQKRYAFAGLLLTALLGIVAQVLVVNLRRTGDVPGLIGASVLLLEFWTATFAFVIVFQLKVATKTILRAIELAAKPPA